MALHAQVARPRAPKRGGDARMQRGRFREPFHTSGHAPFRKPIRSRFQQVALAHRVRSELIPQRQKKAVMRCVPAVTGFRVTDPRQRPRRGPPPSACRILPPPVCAHIGWRSRRRQNVQAPSSATRVALSRPRPAPAHRSPKQGRLHRPILAVSCVHTAPRYCNSTSGFSSSGHSSGDRNNCGLTFGKYRFGTTSPAASRLATPRPRCTAARLPAR